MRAPGAHLQDQVVGVGTFEELGLVLVHRLLQRRTLRNVGAPQFAAPPFLGIQPTEPDERGGLYAGHRLRGVVAAVERRVQHERGDLPVQPDDAVAIGARGARRRHDAVHEVRIADRPLECLLRAHGETDHRAQMAHVQLLGEHTVHGVHVVAYGGDGEMRAVERRRRVAGRGGAAVAEQLAGHQEQLVGIERTAWADQPLVAGHVRHVVGRQKHRVVAGGVQRAVSAVGDVRVRQHGAAFGGEVVQGELVLHRGGGGGGDCGCAGQGG